MSDRNTTTNGHDNPTPMADAIASKAHETVDRVTGSAERIEKTIRARADQAAEAARDGEQRASESVTEVSRRARIYLRKNPLVSASLIFAAGVVVSSLLRK